MGRPFAERSGKLPLPPLGGGGQPNQDALPLPSHTVFGSIHPRLIPYSTASVRLPTPSFEKMFAR